MLQNIQNVFLLLRFMMCPVFSSLFGRYSHIFFYIILINFENLRVKWGDWWEARVVEGTGKRVSNPNYIFKPEMEMYHCRNFLIHIYICIIYIYIEYNIDYIYSIYQEFTWIYSIMGQQCFYRLTKYPVLGMDLLSWNYWPVSSHRCPIYTLWTTFWVTG